MEVLQKDLAALGKIIEQKGVANRQQSRANIGVTIDDLKDNRCLSINISRSKSGNQRGATVASKERAAGASAGGT